MSYCSNYLWGFDDDFNIVNLLFFCIFDDGFLFD